MPKTADEVMEELRALQQRAEPRYQPLEEERAVGETGDGPVPEEWLEDGEEQREPVAQEDLAERVGEGTDKPSMHEVFGPGGFLERCMIGGYEHRQAQLEMAELVHDAFATHHHA